MDVMDLTAVRLGFGGSSINKLLRLLNCVCLESDFNPLQGSKAAGAKSFVGFSLLVSGATSVFDFGFSLVTGFNTFVSPNVNPLLEFNLGLSDAGEFRVVDILTICCNCETNQ